MKLVLFMSFFLSFQVFSHPTFDCTTYWQLGRELGCPGHVHDPMPSSSPGRDDFLVRSEFGPTACKAFNMILTAKKDLKTECEAWLKERKTDLVDRYMTGTCNENCVPCGSGLSRCTYAGVVHYSVK